MIPRRAHLTAAREYTQPFLHIRYIFCTKHVPPLSFPSDLPSGKIVNRSCHPFSPLCHFATQPASQPALCLFALSPLWARFRLSFRVAGKLFPPDFCLIGLSYLHRLLWSIAWWEVSEWEVGPKQTCQRVTGCFVFLFSSLLISTQPNGKHLCLEQEIINSKPVLLLTTLVPRGKEKWNLYAPVPVYLSWLENCWNMEMKFWEKDVWSHCLKMLLLCLSTYQGWQNGFW